MRFLLIFLLFTSILFGNEYVVIVNKNMKKFSNAEIKAIFLKKITFVDDTKIVPINLGANDPIRIKFQEHLLHMSLQRLKSYWMKQHYLGHRPPLSMKSQESIKAFVNKVDGAIGYIDASNADQSIKVIYRWSDD